MNVNYLLLLLLLLTAIGFLTGGSVTLLTVLKKAAFLCQIKLNLSHYTARRNLGGEEV
jgi:hypothetical protein